jgi:glucuronokinase
MQLIRRRAYARAGLMGNPSDGYNGKTISLVVRDFFAEAVLYEWPTAEIVMSQQDQSCFQSVRELVHDVQLHGYYGGVRLVKATIKRFVDYCDSQNISLHDRNFAIRYQTNIPRQVGLAGSSAIIVATLRGLTDFYEVEIPKDVLPSLTLSVEAMELGITAGLQDRVIQVFEGLVYMDFSADLEAERHGMKCGSYEPLDPVLLPPLYLAYSSDVGEPTEVTHAPLRARFDRGDQDVVAAMKSFAELAEAARGALQSDDTAQLSSLIDQNFDLRLSICDISANHLRMINAARRVGASAKFAGSGGAIIGVCPDDDTYARLKDGLAAIQCSVIRPQVVGPA